MKLSLATLFSFTALTSALSPALHARAIDPQTLNPTRLSILKVLRTAIPTGADGQIALPTGTAAPVWYTGLPADITSMLPSLYPETVVASSSSSPVAVVSSSTPVSSPSAISSPISAPSSSATPSKSVIASPTSHPVALATGILGTGSNATASYNGTGTLPGSSASPSAPAGFYSAGCRNPVGVGMLAGMLWIGVGTGFFVFA